MLVNQVGLTFLLCRMSVMSAASVISSIPATEAVYFGANDYYCNDYYCSFELFSRKPLSVTQARGLCKLG